MSDVEKRPAINEVDFEKSTSSIKLQSTSDASRPANTDYAETEYTADEKAFERKLVLKLDIIIMPLLMLTMFMASLGRTDISNAKVLGLVEK